MENINTQEVRDFWQARENTNILAQRIANIIYKYLTAYEGKDISAFSDEDIIQLIGICTVDKLINHDNYLEDEILKERILTWYKDWWRND